MKEIYDNKVAIFYGISVIMGFLAGIIIGLNSIH